MCVRDNKSLATKVPPPPCLILPSRARGNEFNSCQRLLKRPSPSARFILEIEFSRATRPRKNAARNAFDGTCAYMLCLKKPLRPPSQSACVRFCEKCSVRIFCAKMEAKCELKMCTGKHVYASVHVPSVAHTHASAKFNQSPPSVCREKVYA